MLRSHSFNPEREPLRHNTTFILDQSHTRGPVPFLNPTHARYEQHFDAEGNPRKKKEEALGGAAAEDPESGKPKPGLTFQWTSRDNRKGRHRLIVSSDPQATPIDAPKASNSLQSVTHVLWLMIAYYPVWDISYDVAYIFTWGSIVWVINAFFAWLPLVRPSTAFPGETLLGGGITAFIGATIFEIGSVLLLLEAVNAGREGCFGWAVENAWYGESNSSDVDQEDQTQAQQPESNSTQGGVEEKGATRGTQPPKSTRTGASKSTSISVRPDTKHCIHHHPNKRNLVGKAPASNITAQDFASNTVASTDTAIKSSTSRSWTWFPTLSDLRTHYLHELGFLASLVQFFAATIFWISGFTALPGIFNKLSPGALAGAYWTPQVLGGLGFVTSGFLFMLETQPNWYTPAVRTLGWHIGLWNLIGGMGFTLCPAFGYSTRSWAVYEASLSTFWGSWAFLLGSTVQWYESLQKYPVEVRSK